MAETQAHPLATTDSDISPRSPPTPTQAEYFPKGEPSAPSPSESAMPDLAPTGGGAQVIEIETGAKPVGELKGNGNEVEKENENGNDSDASATTPGDTATSTGSSSEPPSRKMSISSVTFRSPADPALPQGMKKPFNAIRRRAASPPHRRFETHVAFDNIPLGESTDYNPIAFTLNAKHAGYQSTRRSRTFMVGVDDNAYSDHALNWLLEELVDDGDEVICVRVIETQTRMATSAYQQSAQELMDLCQSKNGKNLAISLVVEYAVGKLHNTFQHLIKMYQPSMLIVGTKGRSLDSVSGLFVNRSSFSKYCLQYSPVPVVVIRPTEKRKKKKDKRALDPARQSYIHMLPGQKHEADSESSSIFELEPTLTPDEEAHRVAVANGLPARYDPTIKPIDPNALLANLASSKRRLAAAAPSAEAVALAASGRMPAEPEQPGEDDGSDSEYEEEFEVTTGTQALKKERLHTMEFNEGAALKEMRKLSIESIEEEDDQADGGAKTEDEKR